MDMTTAYEKFGSVHLRGKVFRDVRRVSRFFQLYLTEFRKDRGDVWTRRCWRDDPDVGCKGCPVLIDGVCPAFDTQAFTLAATAYDPRHANPLVRTDYHRNRMSSPAAELVEYFSILLPLIEDYDSPHEIYIEKIKLAHDKWVEEKEECYD
jgi:hypothetical protein